MRRGIWNRLFLLSSFGLALFFAVLLWRESFPEWRSVQAEYYQRLARVTGDPSRASGPIKIRQIYLPELKRVDRCVTCHMGIDNPKMADQPQPFRSHPNLGTQKFLASHPFEEIGCTVCHHGQGSATEKAHAHGPVPHWEKPLLAPQLVVGTCTTCHQNTGTLHGAEPLVQARALFEEKGCIGCHILHGKGMLIGPELAESWGKSVEQFDFRHVKGEHTVVNWIVEHFKDPQAVTPADLALGIPETSMPNYHLTDEEIDRLSALVLSFYSETEKEHEPIPARYRVPGSPQPEPSTASAVEKGKAAFVKYGCVGCHGPQGIGGIRNANMDLGEEVPSLLYVSEGYTKEQVKEIIREGRYPARAYREQPSPPIWMPSWKDKISEDEIDALAEYLFSLSPERPTQTSS